MFLSHPHHDRRCQPDGPHKFMKEQIGMVFVDVANGIGYSMSRDPPNTKRCSLDHLNPTGESFCAECGEEI